MPDQQDVRDEVSAHIAFSSVGLMARNTIILIAKVAATRRDAVFELLVLTKIDYTSIDVEYRSVFFTLIK